MELIQMKHTGNIVRDAGRHLDEVRQSLERKGHVHALQAIQIERKEWVKAMVEKYGQDECSKTRLFCRLAEIIPAEGTLADDFRDGDGKIFLDNLEKKILMPSE